MHHLAHEDPATRQEERRHDQLQHQLARADPQNPARKQQIENAQRQQVHASIHPTFRGLYYQPHNIFSTTDVRTLSTECVHCGALKFPVETESLCCLKGNVQLQPFPRP